MTLSLPKITRPSHGSTDTWLHVDDSLGPYSTAGATKSIAKARSGKTWPVLERYSLLISLRKNRIKRN